MAVAELASNCCTDDVIYDKVIDIGRVAPVGSVSIQHSVEGKMFLMKLCYFHSSHHLKLKLSFIIQR